MYTSHTHELINCTHCGHAIRENEPVIADLPGDVPEGLSRAAFRHWHLNCLECNTGVSCYQAYASRQPAFAAQSATACASCGDGIGYGELVLRETLWEWKFSGVREERPETAGGFLGIGKGAKVRPPTSFKDLPFRLRRKFFNAGMGNGRGTRTFAEAEEFYRRSVPRSVRSLGPDAIRDFLRGKDASHIESVANAPSKARLTDNVVLESHTRNLKRGANNMSVLDKSRAGVSNGLDAAMSVGKGAAKSSGKGAAYAAILELPLSVVVGAIRVSKGKQSKEQATKDTVKNTAKAGIVGGVAAAGLTVIAVSAAGPALSAATPVLVPLGVGMYGVSAYRRIKDAAKDNEPLERNVLYFHASRGEREHDLSCFEAFAAEVSESATDQGAAD